MTELEEKNMIAKSKTFVCDKCGGYIFCEGVAFKKISMLQSPDGKEHVVPIPVYYCRNCGEMLPNKTTDGLFDDVMANKEISSLI